VVFLMSIWLFRAGRNGEYEFKFLEDKRIYLTWDGLNVDLSGYQDRDKLLQKLTEMYSGEKPNTIRNWASQIYPIVHRIVRWCQAPLMC
jgi:restriction system protein